MKYLDEARVTAEDAQAKKLDSPYLHAALYQLAFLKNDAAEMAQHVAWASGKPIPLLREAKTEYANLR
jgi:hypothetical protein